MFFRPKATIDEDEESWQLETWGWLLDHLGGVDALRARPSLMPSHDDFPRTGRSGRDHVEAVFAQVAEAMGVEVEAFRLEEQDASVDPKLGPLAVVQNAPVDPAGTYSLQDEAHVVTYDPAQAGDLQSLIATFAHEICHAILLAIPERPPGADDAPLLEEHATDLATVFFGFGVFGGNEAFRFEQYQDAATGTQGWQTRSLGYLTQNEWGYALALRAALSGEPLDDTVRHASSALGTHVRKNARYLARNPQIVVDLEG